MPKRTRSADNMALSNIPSIDDLMRSETAASLVTKVGRKRLTELAREVVGRLREDLRSGGDSSIRSKDDLLKEAGSRLMDHWQQSLSAGLGRVINATGVIIHTNLGRAPLSEAAKKAVAEASGYSNVEYDLTTGNRGKRGARVEAMLCELTGAEAAVVVNNCAAAAYLVLTAFAVGREVIISRGELVEIGGEFRIPDVLARAGVTLIEVGTTNRTKLADYEKAVSENSAMILKVHPSNYRIIGFTSSPSLKELAELARRNNILIYEDAGSGAVSDLGPIGLTEEPIIRDSIAAGADVVTFSGDKLLGGPQAGLIVGKKEVIETLRQDPLYRALRVSKLIYAALEATLESHLRGKAADEIPVIKMLASDAASLERRCRLIVERLDDPNLIVELSVGASAVGGGAAPLAQPESMLMLLHHTSHTAAELERKLRDRDVPVIARIMNDRVVIDLRTVAVDEEDELVSALNQLR